MAIGNPIFVPLCLQRANLTSIVVLYCGNKKARQLNLRMFQTEIFILQLHYNGNRDNANGATQKVGTCVAYVLYNELVEKMKEDEMRTMRLTLWTKGGLPLRRKRVL